MERQAAPTNRRPTFRTVLLIQCQNQLGSGFFADAVVREQSSPKARSVVLSPKRFRE